MPRNEFHTTAGILSQFDARAWSGLTLFNRGGTDVSMPAFTEVGEGIYDDAMQFLNGRASLVNSTFAALLEAAWTAATGATPNVSVGINGDDKLEISADLQFSAAAVPYHGDYGINPAGQSSTLSSGRYVLTADNDWQRGVIYGMIAFTVPLGTCSAPLYGSTAQDLPSLINAMAVETLEYLELAAGYDVRWRIDEDGHAHWSSPSSTSITWVNTSFRDALGFTGSETVTFSPLFGYASTSTYPIAGVIVPSRPVARQNPGAIEETSAKRTMGNGWASSTRGTFQQHTIFFYLDGPLDCKDEMQHWLRRCLPYLSTGRGVTLYQDWGDSRLAARDFDNLDAYSDTYTSEENGFRGRIEGWVVDNSGARYMEFEHRYRRRIPLTLVIEE